MGWGVSHEARSPRHTGPRASSIRRRPASLAGSVFANGAARRITATSFERTWLRIISPARGRRYRRAFQSTIAPARGARAPSRAQNRVRQNANLMSLFKLIWVVQSPGQKYLACAVGQINATDSRVLHSQEGRTRRHERRARDAVDAMASLDERGFVADGEVVWSWHPDAGVKFRGKRFLRDDGGKRARSLGRVRSNR